MTDHDFFFQKQKSSKAVKHQLQMQIKRNEPFKYVLKALVSPGKLLLTLSYLVRVRILSVSSISHLFHAVQR